MKKIELTRLTRLPIVTIGLIMGAFVMLSMALPEDSPEGETVPTSSGPRKSHWTTTDGCGNATYHNKIDYAESKAVTTGNGSVSVSGTNTTSNAKTGTSVLESGSNAYDEVVLTWNCGYATIDQTGQDGELASKHSNTVTFEANPNPGYQFSEWKDNGGTQLSTKNPCIADFSMEISSYANAENSATNYPSTSPYKSTVYYAYFTPITITAPASVERVQAYLGDPTEESVVFTISSTKATTADFNEPSFTATTAGTWTVTTWFVQDGEITVNYRFAPSAQGVYDSDVTLTVTSKAGESANATIPVTVNAAATKYYSQLTAKLSTKSAYDGGEIWASKTEGMVGVDWSTSDQVLSHTAYSNTEAITYYMHAQSKDPNKYIFVGWYRTDACALGDLLSFSADYSVDITPTSTDAGAPTAQTVYARFIRLSEHYLEVTALPHKVGLGMVYASEEAGADQVYSLYSPSGSQAMCEVMSTSTAAVNGTIYVHAYPKYGYKFDGWFTNAECTGAAVSTNAHYAYSAEAVSTDPVVPTKKTLYAKFSMATPINVTFNYPANGTYTASVRDVVVEDGEYVWGEVQVYNSAEQTATITQQMYPTGSITLTATPDAGMAVKSWTDGSSTVTSGSVNYTTTVTAAKTLGVTMGAASPFSVDGTTYSDLHDAIAAAGSTKTIIVVEDCWIPAGDYTIPSGVSLLIPDAADNTQIKKSPTTSQTGNTPPTPFRRVVMAPGTNIILRGNLGLSGTQSGVSSGNPGAGAVVGGYGCLDMSKGGSVTIKSGGKLYAFGIIAGAGNESTSGTITVESGGEVYEDLVIMDLHGGGGTAAIVNGTSAKNNYGVFPFNQFYVQNIEPRMTLQSGATEKVFYYIYASADASGSVNFISNTDASFFGVSAGSSITKWYDYTTDRQCYQINGNVNINAITITVKFSVISMSITSSKFILPIGNFDFTLTDGANMTLTNDAEMLPGARITIAQGANLTIAKSLYLYDYSDWGYYCASGYVRPITTTPGHKTAADARTPAGASTYSRMGQAELVIDGTVTVGASGQIYTTSGGANIYSHGTGKLTYSNAVPVDGKNLYKIYGNYGRSTSGALDATNAYNGTNVAAGQTYIGKFGMAGKNYGAYADAIPCTPAVLRNANGSVYQTAGKAAGTTVRYIKGYWKVLTYDNCLYSDELGHIYTFTDEDDFTEVIVSSIYTEAWEKVEASNLLFIHTADNCDWVKVNAVPEVASTTKLLKDPETNTYYQYSSTKGYWEEATSYTVTFKNYNNKVLQEDKIYPGGVPAYKGLSNPVRPDDETGVYTFIGWKVNGEGETITSFSAVNANTTYIAQYSHTPNVATVNSLGVTTYYTTWASALAAANGMTTNPTLKLLGDVSGIASVQTITKSMTLDLNGHTLSGTVSEMLKINSAIVVTITDGSVGQTGVISSVGTATSGNFYTMSVATGKLILANGTLKGKANGAAVFPILINTTGTFEMEGGRITTDAMDTGNHGMLVKTKNTFIKGGSIDVPGAAVYISNGYSGTDKMTISGGYIKGGTIINSGNSADTRVNVTGGYFSTDASLSSLVEAPYLVLDNVDSETMATYPYEVGKGYRVTFKNGETVLQDGYVKVGATPVYMGATPTKDPDAQYTYTFSTWSPAIEAVTDEDQVYTALFDQTLRQYRLSYNMMGHGTQIAADDVDYNALLTEPTAPTAAGYSFGGWYKEKACVNPWNFATDRMPASAMTLFAKWEERSAGIGTLLDIVDWTTTSITINMNGYSSSSAKTAWTLTVDGNATVYNKDNRKADRTLVVSAGTLTPDNTIQITAKGTDGVVESQHAYTIPHIYTENANITDAAGFDSNSIIYVKAGTLCVKTNLTVKDVFVCPGAELKISAGTLTCDRMILRTTPWKSAAIEGEFSADQTYYTRIATIDEQGRKPNSAYWQFALPLASNTADVVLSDPSNTNLTYGRDWLLRSYNAQSRADNGATGTNWQTLGGTKPTTDTVIVACTDYEFFSNSAYYREYYFPVNPAYVGTSVSLSHATGNAGAQHEGWNAVCSPLMSKAREHYVAPEEATKVSVLTEDNATYWQRIPDVYEPAVPFYVQTKEATTMSFTDMTAEAPVSVRRMKNYDESVATQWLQLEYSDAAGRKDETSIFLHPDKFEESFETGYDVTKLSLSGTRPFVYTRMTCGNLAFNAVPDSLAITGIPVAVYANAAGVHTFTLRENRWLNRLEHVYLYDAENGFLTDLLEDSYSYEAEAGTSEGRFSIQVVFRAPSITTDFGSLDADANGEQQAIKIYRDGHIYILRGARVYDMVGRETHF